MSTTTVRVRGAVFDGRARVLISSGVRTMADAVAQRALDMVQAQLDVVLQNPTGTYQGRLNVRGVNQYAYAVTDDNCVYGPWLEGTGSRNYPVTRFHGYSTFRIVTTNLARETPYVIDSVMSPIITEINTI